MDDDRDRARDVMAAPVQDGSRSAGADAPRDAADVRDAVRDAVVAGRPLRIVAGRSWLDAGRPADAGAELDLAALDGIVEYTPGDLTLTALAATPLVALARAARANGQWLPLDPFGDPRATLGATLATASAGPLASSVGLPRDVALGIEFVTGEGEIVRGGGRVVKNVAGFDLVRLNVGAWGTLGVLTEATVRLRALPECDATIALAPPARASAHQETRTTGDGAWLRAWLAALRAAPLTPIAAELLNPALAARLSLGTSSLVLVRLAGNAENVEAQRATLASLGDTADADPALWERLREVEPAGAATFRLSRRPSELADIWARVESALAPVPDAMALASVERGVVRAIVPGASAEPLALVLAALGTAGALIPERLPAACWSALASEHSAPLAVATRLAFDPGRILNRGVVSGAS